MDDSLIRYWDGHRWTFETAARHSPAPPPLPVAPAAAAPVLRADIAGAVARVRGGLLGAMKEVKLLAEHLMPDEQVLALTGAHGDGSGVLVCTNRRLLFLFIGIVRRQFLAVEWNAAKAVVYTRSARTLQVFTTRPSKRAVPALSVRVYDITDAEAIINAAQAASAAPRLDVA
ncbi:hypothetical protein BJP25_14835 [Actinokineospora bangkokensis]|uniref:DUF2510 domain-containing protein n=1 Tax=Actinokineospora bangkokensis TaxID=1193682 RepID=A0A1Q9LPG1_9PSEU|nr:hypothetical protein BJP25_14835 [Actinokineospora bangkokensis]